ncbi:cobalt ECF transporter T component CbiQ [Methanococcus aeolicus]|uniref:Cobalt ABC transporter, inner membrane subunit CbiQ n=1 Tax=Methanococcus aeolicus (strain ATCC BAA-1280 / DSM 17508 / OCM 812 / Nankai-3) TaxID=419665 RepID=A6UT58_META3|nr:cobalt ECF transporter T component CbiQ [Methanococcus aeolicus]ABR55680.1 cobalt ABC transporter, inner membrane subunit CbiQ [Methanococcus aeolicus Nankai-3]UXM85179.1 cobalt ECF transporter T component CbiQ [Methanococcus aeolicus]
MHHSLRSIERELPKNSIIHNLDSRVKLIFVLMLVITSAILNNIQFVLLIWLYIIFIILISRISIINTIKRIILILPFGMFLAFFQPFIKGDTVIYTILGAPIYYEGILFGALLFSKFLVSITAIVFLSSTTPMHEVIIAGRRLGLPPIMATMLGLMVRYLFIMYDILENTLNSQKSRCLSRKNISYKSLLNIFGYSIGSLFIRSYEQGERTYLAMTSRGYSENSNIMSFGSKIKKNDILFLAITAIFLITLLILQFLN